MSDNHHATFLITGALALAAAHLVRQWENPNNVPELLTSDGSMSLKLDGRGSGIADLRKTIKQVRSSAETLVESCDAWLQEIDKQFGPESAHD